MQQGELIEQRNNARAAGRRALLDGNEEEAKKQEAQYDKLQDAIVGIELHMAKQASMSDEEREVCLATVMFDSEELKNTVLDAYARQKSWVFRVFQKKHMRF